jgi:hypothetical protein
MSRLKRIALLTFVSAFVASAITSWYIRANEPVKGEVVQTGTLILENCRDGFCYDESGNKIGRDKAPFVLTSPVANN